MNDAAVALAPPTDLHLSLAAGSLYCTLHRWRKHRCHGYIYIENFSRACVTIDFFSIIFSNFSIEICW
ncbi:hypothetical protein EB796_021997 [Bugula neritina]|uniref:Uncharacterized protein n=1 Tax=Bugula neritina TaxID=10212 RepID=A0A7J7J0Q9_BUGNE|nr:hypothetical protein EB796_021997 [Bugula neritina]